MKKNGLLLVVGICLFAIAGVICPAGSAQAQSSEWEISTTMEIPGMPFAMPPNTFRHCMDDHGVPYQQNEGEECSTVSKKVSGDTVTWQIKCEGEDGPVEMSGVSTYTGSHMNSKVKMKSRHGEVSMHMTGKKLGPCK
jgi:hypothetical protein